MDRSRTLRLIAGMPSIAHISRWAKKHWPRNHYLADTITQVENTLIQNGIFHLPGKKASVSKENEGRTFVVDVTAVPK